MTRDDGNAFCWYRKSVFISPVLPGSLDFLQHGGKAVHVEANSEDTTALRTDRCGFVQRASGSSVEAASNRCNCPKPLLLVGIDCACSREIYLRARPVPLISWTLENPCHSARRRHPPYIHTRRGQHRSQSVIFLAGLLIVERVTKSISMTPVRLTFPSRRSAVSRRTFTGSSVLRLARNL